MFDLIVIFSEDGDGVRCLTNMAYPITRIYIIHVRFNKLPKSPYQHIKKKRKKNVSIKLNCFILCVMSFHAN